MPEQYQVADHNGHDLAAHTYLGTTPRGVPAWIDSRYLAAELKITVGLIEPHFMAGFSGGRKLICPGLAALETIKVWHGPAFLEHPNARAGCLEGNPVHEENTRIARMAGCDFIVNVVIDDRRRVLSVVAGDMEAAFQEGVAFARRVVTDTRGGAGRYRGHQFGRLPLGRDLLPVDQRHGGGAADRQAGRNDHPCRGLERGNRQPRVSAALRRPPVVGSVHGADRQRRRTSGRTSGSWRSSSACIGMPRSAWSATVFRPMSCGGCSSIRRPSVEAAVAAALQRHGPAATIAAIPKGPYVLAEVAA